MRAAGILLPVSSLASNYGIGTMGKAAFDFIDFLEKAGQSYWQVLPVGPTGFGDSPYQSFSAFAGNPYLIDLDILADDGLLLKEEIDGRWGDSPDKADYGLIYLRRFKVLENAVKRQDKQAADYTAFCAENAYWLDDYALFMALKEEHNGRSFSEWPLALRKRKGPEFEAAQKRCEGRAQFWKCLQFFFYKQWYELKKYANSRGIKIIGDIPIYVSPDSSDLWANPLLFQVDEDGLPTCVAGVPPDSFSADGQLWGNPLYDWMHHSRTKYRWWIQRMAAAVSLYDVVRIDHFRGFAGYFSVEAGASTAREGQWVKGPGKSFIRAIRSALPNAVIIAENLGVLTPDVYELMDFSGYPGMEVMQFAFNPGGDSQYLPHNYKRNTVVYTGTHDNMTSAQWADEAPENEVSFARDYFGAEGGAESLVKAMVRGAYMSVAETVIIPMQDWLCLGRKARINTPSTVGGNWEWRLKGGELGGGLADEIYCWSMMYSRLNPSVEKRSVSLPEKAKAKETPVDEGLPREEEITEEKAASAMPVLSIEEMKQAEEKAISRGGSVLELMEKAGRGAAQRLMDLAKEQDSKREVLILCGKGNNGGDAYVMARILSKNGWRVEILPVFGKETRISEAAWKNRRRLPDKVRFKTVQDADFGTAFIVDGVFGTGYGGLLPENVKACFDKANSSEATRISLDIPSGINADSGEACTGCFDAHHTLAFGACKPGAMAGEGKSPIGRLHLVEIGIEEFIE